MVMPTMALAVGQIAIYMRLLRSDMIADAAGGLHPHGEGEGHPDPPGAVAPRAPALEPHPADGRRPQVGALIGGAVVIEFLFGIPGMGQLIGFAIGTRQYVALQSGIAVVAIGFVVINFFIDFLYNVLDPRIRERRT